MFYSSVFPTVVCLIVSVVASPFPAPSPQAQTLAQCLSSKNVPVSNSSSPNFAQLAEPYNLRLAYVPAVIILPNTTQHISDAVVCAAASGVKVQVRQLPCLSGYPS